VRASEFGNPAWDNTAPIRRILELRQEAARLLGYDNFAEVSLVPKMAQAPSEVLVFLRDLAARGKPFAERDMAELSAFARSELLLDTLAAWDLPYVSEKLRQTRYSFSDQEVKQYFPEERVLAGMFRVVETIFGVQIRESRAESWDPSVRFFDVRDQAQTLVGQFYLDLYARANKRGGAWMDHAINRRRRGGRVQHPVAYLTCNFSAPVAQGGIMRPALFTHDEVQTLFHEFGHGLNLLLTQVDVPGVSGLEGVEWDAVELPSQFMENFCWEWEVLKHMTAHVDSGAPLPRALFDRMLAAKNFQSGMQLVRSSSSRCSTCTCTTTSIPTRRSRLSSWSGRSAARWASCRGRTSIVRPMHSATSLPAGTPPAITATSGPRFCRRMPTACSRNKACSRPRQAPGSGTRSSRAAGAGPRWTRSWPFGGGRPKSMPC
jgi:oligopeptidase A